MKSRIVESLDLPKDVVLGAPIVTVYGYDQIVIENNKGVLMITDNQICVRTKDCILKITGRSLSIRDYSKDIIIIKGTIFSIAYDY